MLVQPAYYEDEEGNTRIKTSKVRTSHHYRHKAKNYFLWLVNPNIKAEEVDKILEDNPICVTYTGSLIDGMCRLRTAQEIGKEDLPCIVRG